VVAVDVARLVERIKTRVEHEADKRFFAIGAWLYRRTNGRIVRLRHRRALILTASGRRSGLPRSVLLQFFPDGHDMVVVAANGGLPTYPDWYFNLKAHPHARVEVEGTSMQVRAEELSAEDAAAFWPRVLEIASDYAKVSEADRSCHSAHTTRPRRPHRGGMTRPRARSTAATERRGIQPVEARPGRA
jgi:deazaflavin-dependent oxidoreductase (nitroreductase family)